MGGLIFWDLLFLDPLRKTLHTLNFEGGSILDDAS